MFFAYIVSSIVAGIVVCMSISGAPVPIAFPFIVIGAIGLYIIVLEALWKGRAYQAFLADIMASIPAFLGGALGCLLTPFVGIPVYLITWWMVFSRLMARAISAGS